ncbi:MAG TPA: histidinol dehydrogenase [Candidatus Obscuribacterales bacterium]
MIPIYKNDDAHSYLKAQQKELNSGGGKLSDVVRELIETVRTSGDVGLQEIVRRLGDPLRANFRLTEREIEDAVSRLPADRKSVIQRAADRIEAFASKIRAQLQPGRIDYDEFSVGFAFAAVESTACYVPGGNFPLPSTALMTAITARVAGVRRILIVSPKLTDEVVYAGTLAGVKEFFQVGGAQAVAALAFGTESIPRVDMIVGPGNAYVTEAKRQLQGIVGIDALAGPSEIAVLADESADPKLIAADLLSQAEHSPDARAYLITSADSLIEPTICALTELVSSTDVPTFIRESLENSAVLVFDSIDMCVEAVNEIAPEHLELHILQPQLVRNKLKNFGTLFLGVNSTVPFGDYMTGANHTLPTNRSARFAGALSPVTFLRIRNWIEVSSKPAGLVSDTMSFASIEGLSAHAEAARLRLFAETTNHYSSEMLRQSWNNVAFGFML